MTPTPSETTATIKNGDNNPSITSDTWFAKISKSGSAIEIKNPNKTPIKNTV